MTHIRKAVTEDVSRIAEILVFVKRMNYRSIFMNDDYSFGELQVISVAQEYLNTPELMEETFVYDDGIVRGLLQVGNGEIKKLYVDHFFQSMGIGEKLLRFAVEAHGARFLYALEKNTRAVAFYERHGFHYTGKWEYEEGTTERLLRLER